MKKVFLLLLITTIHQCLNAQVKIGGTNTTVKNASLLELESTNKGLVFPRIALTSLDSRLPLASDIVSGTVVYNTNANLATGAGLVVWKDGRWSAMLATDASGVSVTDSVLSASPISNTNIYAYNVAIVGNRAYLAARSNGLYIFNIINPSAPVLLGNYDPTGSVADVTVAGNLAYLPAHTGGMYIVNISNPANPALLGTYNIGSAQSTINVVGNVGYIADGRRLKIVSLSTPSSPVEVGSYTVSQVGYNISGIQIQGSLAYLSVEGQGLFIINVSNPTAPALVGSFTSIANGNDIAVDANYAYVAAGTAGLQIIKISAPATPVSSGSYTTGSPNYMGVRVQGDFAYVADYSYGLRVFSIRDRENPVLIDSYKTAGTCESVELNGQDVYISNGTRGLAILRMGSEHNTISITKDRVQLAALSSPQGRGFVVANDSGKLDKIVISRGLVATNGQNGVTAITYLDTTFKVAITDLNATVVYDSTEVHAIRIGNQVTLKISGHVNLTIPNKSSITLEPIPSVISGSISFSNYSMFIFPCVNGSIRGAGSGYISGNEITLYSNANPQGSAWNGTGCGFTTFTIQTLID